MFSLALAARRVARPSQASVVRCLAKKKKTKGGKAKGKAAAAAPEPSARGGEGEGGEGGAADIFDEAFDAPLTSGLDKAVSGFERSLGRMRGSGTSADLFEQCQVAAYGGFEALSSVAHVAVRSPTLVEIACFDPQLAKPVADAVRDIEGLSLNPTVNGSDVVVPVPRPSKEQRAALAKAAAQAAEAAKTRTRRLRKDAHDALKKAAAAVSEDDVRAKKAEIDGLVDDAGKKIAALLDAKKADLLG